VWETISQAPQVVPGATIVGNSHHISFPGFFLPSKYIQEDDQAWEMHSQAFPPSGYPPGWSHYPYLVNIFLLAYLSIILLAGSKSVTAKMFEKKSGKNTRPCRTSTACDPAKRGLERTRIELTMLDFRPGGKRACQLTRGFDGIDRDFLFGNARHPVLAPGCTPFPSRLGGTQVGWGLSPVGNNHSIVYLGFDTSLVSPGTSPVTLALGGWGWKSCYCACYRYVLV